MEMAEGKEIKMPVSEAAAAAAAAAAKPYKIIEWEGKEIKTTMVKMDERHGYIQWLLEWDKKPRRPLPNLPEDARAAMEAFKAEREAHEKALAQYRRCGYAHIQVDIFDDDDPRANLDDDEYEEVDFVDDGEERILGRL